VFLIDDLLGLPIGGIKFVLRTLARTAEEQYTDDAPVKEHLLELQLQLESGEISEEEYVELEGGILRQLREIENRKREMAGLPLEQSRPPISGIEAGSASVSVHLEGGNAGPKKPA
jgi:Gas vesicle protein G